MTAIPQWWSLTLATTGIVGVWLAGSRRRVGWTVGVAVQVLWVAYALATRQYGFIVSALGYGAVNARNWWRWTTSHSRPASHRGVTARSRGGRPVSDRHSSRLAALGFALLAVACGVAVALALLLGR